MNKAMMAALVLLGSVGSGLAMAESYVYTLQQGEAWKGVQVTGQMLRTRDLICRDQTCFPVTRIQPLDRPMLRQYGLSDYGFEAIAELAAVTKQGNRLRLPADMGAQLYWHAVEDDDRDRGNKR